MAIRSGLEKCVFRKYHRKWTEKQIKPPPRFWRIGFSSSVSLARDTRSPLLSHAALPPRRFCSAGSQRPATPSLRCPAGHLWSRSRERVSDADLGAECTSHLRHCPCYLDLRTVCRLPDVLLQLWGRGQASA